MTSRFLHKVLIILTACTALSVAKMTGQNNSQPVAPIKISATIDTATLTMGERTTLHVEVLKNGHVGDVVLPIQEANPQTKTNANIGGIEIRQIDVDSADLGNNRVQMRYDILLQPFKPDDYILPAFKYGVDGDTFKSNVIALKVLEPEIPQEMRDSLMINPLRPPMSIKAEWYDWVPDSLTRYWYWFLLGALLIAAGITVLILYKKNGKYLLPQKKVIPPYELATRRLDALKRKRLHEQGNNKAYYTELTDILRQYLGGRFHIFALEMTSAQIVEALEMNPQTAPFVSKLKEMFSIADFVKFAKQQSTPDENIWSFNIVHDFVRATRPVEQTDEKKKENAK